MDYNTPVQISNKFALKFSDFGLCKGILVRKTDPNLPEFEGKEFPYSHFLKTG
jgi:hypothetical protein